MATAPIKPAVIQQEKIKALIFSAAVTNMVNILNIYATYIDKVSTMM